MLQPAALRRCASCERWGGERRACPPEYVEITAETSCGPCQGGPWNGSERRARSACGHWTAWSALGPGGASASV